MNSSALCARVVLQPAAHRAQPRARRMIFRASRTGYSLCGRAALAAACSIGDHLSSRAAMTSMTCDSGQVPVKGTIHRDLGVSMEVCQCYIRVWHTLARCCVLVLAHSQLFLLSHSALIFSSRWYSNVVASRRSALSGGQGCLGRNFEVWFEQGYWADSRCCCAFTK